MAIKNSLDVLVVGAGPIGLFCANELSRHGLTCRIVDKKSFLSDKSKALGLHIRTLDVLEDCGFFEEVSAQGLQVDGAIFKSNGKKLFEASFEHIQANRHYLIDLPQDKTERILFAGLQNKNIEVEWETELTEVSQSSDQVRTILTKVDGSIEHVASKWLIACDGGHSTVRELSKIPFVGSEYKENWWLADLLIDWTLPENKMVLFLSPHGPLACFPMGSKRYRLVLTAPSGQNQEPSFEDIEAAFNLRSDEPATLSAPIWITKFYLHHRQIQNYRLKRLFFAGDAAHIHSPMGGQGLNTGIQDIYNLIWKLALVEKKQAFNSILDSYHEERFPVGHKVLKETDIMTKMATLKNPLAIKIRNCIISFVMSFAATKSKVATTLAEVDISYAKSSLVKNLVRKGNVRAGAFLPNFSLANKKGKVVDFKEISQGTQHHLFLFSGINSTDLSPLINLATVVTERFHEAIAVHVILINKPTNETALANVWIDGNAKIHNQYSMSNPCALLLRPDKYVGFIQMPIEEQPFFNYLNKIFIPM